MKKQKQKFINVWEFGRKNSLELLFFGAWALISAGGVLLSMPAGLIISGTVLLAGLAFAMMRDGRG